MENDSATKVQAHAQQAEASYQNQELGANAKTETEAATTKVVSVHLAEPESIFPLGWVVAGGGGGAREANRGYADCAGGALVARAGELRHHRGQARDLSTRRRSVRSRRDRCCFGSHDFGSLYLCMGR